MIITKTPYRISFFGGGSDYPEWYKKHGGSFLSSTIDKYVYLNVRQLPSFVESSYRVVWSKVEAVNKIKDIQHNVVREMLKESQNEIPEYLDEKIYYLGQAYNFIYGSTKLSYLFNGNHETTQTDFNNYLKLRGYKFKKSSNEIGGYVILKNKYASLIMDTGNVPEKI